MMQITRSKTQYLHTTILIIVALFVWVLSSSAVATANMYTDSAHGNDSSGVNRSTPTCENWPGGECVTGSCAHCHDTFDPNICVSDVNGLMLFAPNNPTSQTDNLCFQCHKGTGFVQVGGITNNDYGSTFGGGSPTFTNIYDAFNPTGANASSHNLEIVLNYAVSQGWGYVAGNNACTVCHNPHSAQKNFPVSINQTLGGVNTAIKNPSLHSSDPGNLWGDETGSNEIFSEWTGVYQAPYRVGQTTYEPDGSGSEPTGGWGSNLPNYVGLCANACHRLSVNGLEAINWTKDVSGFWPGGQNVHGKYVGWRWWPPSFPSVVIEPYIEDSAGGYCLSCLDCHEPHGSTNPFLLRRYVNGTGPITVTADGDGLLYLWDFCSACHDIIAHMGPSSTCTQADCHTHGWWGTGIGPTL